MWQGSPCQMQQAYAAAHRSFHQEQLEKRIHNTWGDLYGAKDRLEQGINLLPARRALESKYTAQHIKPAIRALALGHINTGVDHVRRVTLSIAPCPLCNSTTDDYYHRVVECQHDKATSAREYLPMGWLKEVKRAGRSHFLGNGHVVPHVEGIKKIDKWHPVFNAWTPAGEDLDESTPFAFLPDLPVYTDGSCFLWH